MEEVKIEDGFFGRCNSRNTIQYITLVNSLFSVALMQYSKKMHKRWNWLDGDLHNFLSDDMLNKLLIQCEHIADKTLDIS